MGKKNSKYDEHHILRDFLSSILHRPLYLGENLKTN